MNNLHLLFDNYYERATLRNECDTHQHYTTVIALLYIAVLLSDQ